MHTETATAPVATPVRRVDFYTPIHKALRAYMSHVLVKVGTVDVDDDEQRHTADDHLLHAEAFGNLEDEARALRHAKPMHRAQLALRLYRHLAEFVGENLVHMQVEETRINQALWDLYDDAELMALHERLLAAVPPAEMALVVRWMAPALNPAELAQLFTGMQAKAPAPAFEAMLDIARRQLSPARWAQLARALGRPPVPGLMSA